MKTQHGFTLMELMIVVVFLAILVAITVSACTPKEPVCVGGMQYIREDDGDLEQIIGPNGGGLACTPDMRQA